MMFSTQAVAALALAVSAVAWTPTVQLGWFITKNKSTLNLYPSGTSNRHDQHGILSLLRFHSSECYYCRECTPVVVAHTSDCDCDPCSNSRKTRRLFMSDTPTEGSVATTTTTTEDEDDDDDSVPIEVEAMDGVESEEEAHNTERPARRSIRKKGAETRGKPISEYTVGDTVTGKVKAIASYGAFLDIGSTTDGLLHISQLSMDFVADVTSILEMGQEVNVRIIKIDQEKGQVALSLLTQEQADSAQEASTNRAARQQRGGGGGGRGGGGGGGPNRRDDSAILSQLIEKGWNSEQFVEGTVVSTVDFGAFVRIDAKQLQEDVEGEFDGLVHISALTVGRVSSVESVVSVNDKVQVRVKAIADRKVSLTMVSVEDEAAKLQAMGGGNERLEGAKDWKESLAKMQQDVMPEFKNRPLVVDLRK